MDEKQTVKGKSKKLKKYYLLIFILFLFLLGGIFVNFKSSTKTKLRSKIDALSAEGYPVTLKELDQSYSIPDNVENAADFILEAISNYNEPNDPILLNIIHDLAKISSPRELLSDETMAHAAEYLRDNQKALDLLHKAATLEHCRYPVNISVGQTPKFVDIIEMIKLLGFEAIVHAENGDGQASVDALICSLNIIDSLANAPFLICQLAGAAYHESVFQTLEYIINTTEFNDEQLAQLYKTLTDKKRLPGITHGLIGELCSAVNQFVKLTTTRNLSGSGMSLPERLFFSVYKNVGLLESDGIIYLDIINKFIEVSKLPLHERLEAAKQIQTDINNISSVHILLKNGGPNYKRYLSRELSSISKLRAAQTAIAVQRYRLKYGELPDSLSNLVPEFLESVPLDPFDGKELRYKKLDSGFVVYSVDEDLVDDGGQKESKNRQQKVPHWDITFTIKK